MLATLNSCRFQLWHILFRRNASQPKQAPLRVREIQLFVKYFRNCLINR